MRLTEEQAQKLGIEPECNCGPIIMYPDGLTESTCDRTDNQPHYIFCPLGQWLAARRALGVK